MKYLLILKRIKATIFTKFMIWTCLTRIYRKFSSSEAVIWNKHEIVKLSKSAVSACETHENTIKQDFFITFNRSYLDTQNDKYTRFTLNWDEILLLESICTKDFCRFQSIIFPSFCIRFVNKRYIYIQICRNKQVRHDSHEILCFE